MQGSPFESELHNLDRLRVSVQKAYRVRDQFSAGLLFRHIATPGKRKEVWTSFLHQIIAQSLHYLQTRETLGVRAL